MEKKYDITTSANFTDFHCVQQAIEHIAKELIGHSDIHRKIGERCLSDFEIGYYCDMLKGLIKLRENAYIN
jgi:hypothetical protein